MERRVLVGLYTVLTLLVAAMIALAACDTPTPPAPVTGAEPQQTVEPPTPLQGQRAAERNIGISPGGGIVICPGGCPGFGFNISNGTFGFGF